MKKILIVDDDVAVTNYLMVFLMQTEQYEPTVLNDSSTVPEVLTKENFDVLLLDMDMPNLSGMDILTHIHNNKIKLATVVLTGVSDVDLAVQAMKLGAFDYLTKPVEEEHLIKVLDAAIEHNQLHLSIEQLPAELSFENLHHQEAFQSLLTCDKHMIRIYHLAEKMAMGEEAIFIIGERGTGKERLARAIHSASPRNNAGFTAVDAGTYDQTEFPRMLFGQARDWSGTHEEHHGFLEKANKGTLYIDSIDQLSRPTQLKLLRYIQKKEFYREGSTQAIQAEVRIIAGSDYDLSRSETVSCFDRNLLYHLMINSLTLPPLRERKCDIQLLVNHFLAEENGKRDRKIKRATPHYLEILQKYFFSGNLHELKNIIVSSVVFCEGEELTEETLPQYIVEHGKHGNGHLPLFQIQSLAEVQRQHVRRMLDHFGDNISECARALEISEEQLLSWKSKLDSVT